MNLNHVSMNAFVAGSLPVNGNGFVVVAQRSTRPTGLMSRGSRLMRSPAPSAYLPNAEKQAWPSLDRRPGIDSCHETTAMTRLTSLA